MALTWYPVVGYPMPSDIPTVILEMVAASHGYQLDRDRKDTEYRTIVLQRVNREYRAPIIDTPPTVTQLSLVARFLNATVRKWTDEAVLQRHWQYTSAIMADVDSITVDNVEMPSPHNREVVHPVLCYGYCRKHQIPVCPDSTVEDMKRYITLHRYSAHALLAITRMALGTPITHARVHALAVGIVDAVPYQWSEKQISPSTIQTVSALKNALDVKSHRSAIVMAAMRYGMNISRCRNPMLALVALADKRITVPTTATSGMMPIEQEWQSNMRNIYNDPKMSGKNPVVRLTGFFHSHIGRNYDKDAFITDEGLEVWQHPPGDVVCYIHNTGPAIPITYQALARMFRIQCNYNIPGANTPTPEDIAHLLTIANSQRIPELVQAIEMVAMMNDATQRCYADAGMVYHSSNSTDKQRIQDAIKAILAAAMAMRGWDGTDATIHEKLTNLDNRRGDEATDQTVSMMLERLHQCVALVPQCNIMGLTMLQPDRNKVNTKMTPMLYMGAPMTIATKLAIMSGVLPGDVIGTCIRIASNQLLAVYYRASVVILGVTPFELPSVKFTAS